MNRSLRPVRPPRVSMGAWFLVIALVMLAVWAALIAVSRQDAGGTPLRLDQFLTEVEAGRVATATILDNDGLVVGEYTPRGGTTQPYVVRYFRDEGRQSLSQILLRAGVPTTIDQQFTKLILLPAIFFMLPALIVVLVFAYFILSARRGTGLFAVRSGARRIAPEDTTATFDDVAGQDAAVEDLREVSSFLSDPSHFSAVGAKVPKGILLYGPPGCGKTLAARALAGEAGAAFYSISGSDFVELYVGVGASRMRELFRQAREHAPALVFIDELDSVARRRQSGEAAGAGAAAEQEQALNQLLAEMDGFSISEDIIVIGATNRPDTLDPALLRPGRMDRSVGFELPDQEGRHAILRVHGRGKPFTDDVDLAAIAERAVGMTGADLASVVNEAGLLAGRARESRISQRHLDAALEKVMEVPERQRRLSMRDRTIGQRTLAADRMSFSDVAGVDDALEELREVRDYLAAPDRFAAMGARIPRGYLLAGPPGCGKTLLARAVAGESNAAFISASATEFVERHLGVGAARVRDLFAEARSVAPAILFIDEIDSIGGARGTGVNDSGEAHQTLNQILIELDGFSQRSGVVVMAATNRADVLDPALVRPGRFDRQIRIELPDLASRRAILALHAADKRVGGTADLDAVARLTHGMSGADLANVMNEAALLATRRGGSAIQMRDLDEAVERATLGIGGARRMSDADRRAIAYHEAGHGLVALALPGGRVLHKLSIVPRGGSLGSAWLAETDDRYTHSRSMLIERMAAFLGGRVAEELVFGEPGDNAAADLATVTQTARRMVTQLGMSKAVGPVNHADLGGGHGGPAYSEQTAQLIDSEVRALVGEAAGLARGVLADSREALDRVAATLIERETLSLAEVEEIAGPVSARSVA